MEPLRVSTTDKWYHWVPYVIKMRGEDWEVIFCCLSSILESMTYKIIRRKTYSGQIGHVLTVCIGSVVFTKETFRQASTTAGRDYRYTIARCRLRLFAFPVSSWSSRLVVVLLVWCGVVDVVVWLLSRNAHGMDGTRWHAEPLHGR